MMRETRRDMERGAEEQKSRGEARRRGGEENNGRERGTILYWHRQGSPAL